MIRPTQLSQSAGRCLGVAALFCALLLPTGISAQGGPALTTVGEILDCHYQARGGAAWDKLRTLKLEGTYSAFSTPAPFTLYRARQGDYRFETTLLDQPAVEAFHGSTPWMLYPLLGFSWPIPAPPAEAVRMGGMRDFDGPLIHAREKGNAVRLVQLTDFEGTPVYHLEMNTAHGTEETWYLAIDSCLGIGREAPTSDFGRPMIGRTYYSDFRPVAGVLLPHRIEEEFGIRYRITEVTQATANPDLDSQLFAYRPSPAMEELAWLEGTWQVSLESRPAERAPWSPSHAVTIVSSAFGGTQLRHLIGRSDGVFEHLEERTLTYDRFRESYVLTVFDQLTNHSQRLVGKLEDGVLTLSDQATDSAAILGAAPTLTRLVFRDLSPNAFVIERHESSDAGETWALLGKEAFTRSGG